jgi:hypothetical protein
MPWSARVHHARYSLPEHSLRLAVNVAELRCLLLSASIAEAVARADGSPAGAGYFSMIITCSGLLNDKSTGGWLDLASFIYFSFLSVFRCSFLIFLNFLVIFDAFVRKAAKISLIIFTIYVIYRRSSMLVVTLLNYVQEVSGSNTGSDTGYHGSFRSFPYLLEANAGYTLQLGHDLLLSFQFTELFG